MSYTKIFIDTWGWLTLRDRSEAQHHIVKMFYQEFRENRGISYTTDYVLDETITLLFRRLPFQKASESLEKIEEAIETGYLILERITSERFENAKELRLRYQDKPLISFTDFTSAVVMIEKEIDVILTEDEHFTVRRGRPLLFADFLDSLPNILVGRDFRKLIEHIVSAYNKGKPVVAMMGGHVIKCGLSPVIISLMEKGIINAIALNGAGSIHDFEIALIGETSEDVAENIQNGTFGMSEETGRLMNEAIKDAAQKGYGMGEGLGRKLLELDPPLRRSPRQVGACPEHRELVRVSDKRNGLGQTTTHDFVLGQKALG